LRSIGTLADLELVSFMLFGSKRSQILILYIRKHLVISPHDVWCPNQHGTWIRNQSDFEFVAVMAIRSQIYHIGSDWLKASLSFPVNPAMNRNVSEHSV
jgi:hypothetical protein